jgi:hypothetical protein
MRYFAVIKKCGLAVAVIALFVFLAGIGERPNSNPTALSAAKSDGRSNNVEKVVKKATTSTESRTESAAVSPPVTESLPMTGNSPLNQGDQLITQAIKELEKAPSIVAQIKHESHMFGQLLVGDGTYQQLRHPDGVMTRLELSIRTESQATSLRHVSNGRFLYIHEQKGNEQTLGRVDLVNVRDSDEGFQSVVNSISIGGLPRLLAELQKNFKFRTPQAITFHGVPVLAVAGEWRPERIELLIPGRKGLVKKNGKIDLDKLPRYIPDRVFVLLGRDGLFPYRVEYRKDVDSNVGSEAAIVSSSNDSLLTMDLYRVQIGAHIDPLEFSYRPGDHQKIEDYTRRFTRTLR